MKNEEMVSFECRFVEGPGDLQNPDFFDGAVACATIDGFPEDPDGEGAVIAKVWLTKGRQFIVDWHDNGYRMNEAVLELVKNAKKGLMEVFCKDTQETTITLALTGRELEVLKNYAKQFMEKPSRPPMFALKVKEPGEYKEVSLNEAEGAEDALFAYGSSNGDYQSYHTIEEVVQSEYDPVGPKLVPYAKSDFGDYAEYLENYGIDPDDVTAYLPIYQEKTLALGFSEAEMPAVKEDLSNHIFGQANILPEYGTSFGHSAGDFAPMVSALRKVGEALLKK